MEIAPKELTFSSLNSSPNDSFFVNGNRAQWTRFLFMKLEPRGLDFCSATSPKIQTRASLIYTPTHLTIALTLHTSPHREHSLNPHRSLTFTLTLTQISRRATPSLKPTPVLTTLTLKPKHRSSLSLKPKHRSSLSLKPCAAPLRVSNLHRPHSLLLFKPKYTQTPNTGPQSLNL